LLVVDRGKFMLILYLMKLRGWKWGLLVVLLVLGGIKGSPVLAQAGEILTYIGNMQTVNTYTHWWYTAENPALQGTAEANAAVTVTIDDVANDTTADASGNWSLSPTTLTNGDHQVTLASGATSYSFTLTIGSSVPETVTSDTTATESGETLPVAGGLLPTVGLTFGGLMLILGGSYYWATAKRYK
jgi:hypothetical protein